MNEIKTTEELYIEILELIAQLDVEHNKFMSGIKTSGQKARAATTKLGVLLKEYRKQSVIKQKTMKTAKKEVSYDL